MRGVTLRARHLRAGSPQRLGHCGDVSQSSNYLSVLGKWLSDSRPEPSRRTTPRGAPAIFPLRIRCALQPVLSPARRSLPVRVLRLIRSNSGRVIIVRIRNRRWYVARWERRRESVVKSRLAYAALFLKSVIVFHRSVLVAARAALINRLCVVILVSRERSRDQLRRSGVVHGQYCSPQNLVPTVLSDALLSTVQSCLPANAASPGTSTPTGVDANAGTLISKRACKPTSDLHHDRTLQHVHHGFRIVGIASEAPAVATGLFWRSRRRSYLNG